MGKECMKLCNYATYINMLEMQFNREELKLDGAKDAERRFKNSKIEVKKFLKTNNIKQKMILTNKKNKIDK